MPNKTSPHILGTAANLLGFCLIVISSLHIAQKTQNSFVDEFASIIALVLTVSCILSFTSIKSRTEAVAQQLERWADVLFFVALLGIFAIICYVTIHVWNN